MSRDYVLAEQIDAEKAAEAPDSKLIDVENVTLIPPRRAESPGGLRLPSFRQVSSFDVGVRKVLEAAHEEGVGLARLKP